MSSLVPVSPVFDMVEASAWFLNSSGPLPADSTSPARVFVHSNYMCGVSSLPGSFSFTVVDMVNWTVYILAIPIFFFVLRKIIIH